jgi:hypothetical protein
VSLRAQPVVEHASLPGGGSVEIWVGVPDDSYVARADLTTVDLQLREAESVLASVTTVLGPDQDGAARKLARDVRAGIEAGTVPLTAAGLEPFADRLR